MGKIKILRIIARLNIGGPAIHTILLTEGLNSDRFESRLVCGSVDRDEADMMYLAHSKGIKPVIIPELGREISLGSDLIAFWKLFRLMRRQRPDIVHTHTAKAGTLGRLAALLYNLLHFGRRCRLFHTFHGHVFYGYFSGLKSRFFIFIERILAFFTDRIIAVSERIRQDLLDYRVASTDKISVIKLGFDLDKFLAVPARNDSGGNYNIGIIGRLAPVKNHYMFLRVVKAISEACLELRVKFVIVGDGQLREQLEEYAHGLGISDIVRFRGWQKDLPAVYEDLDIAALTSLNEGTPVSLIEAMASARPVVSTCVGGVADILSDTKEFDITKPYYVAERGILVKSGDVENFKDALLFLLGNSRAALRIAQSGREYSSRIFKKERLLRDIEMLYNNALSERIS